MAYPNQKDSARYLIGKKNELEKSPSRKIARFWRNSRVIPGFFSFPIHFFSQWAIGLNPFDSDRPCTRLCRHNKVGPGHLLKFSLNSIPKSPIEIEMSHLKSEGRYSQVVSGLAWACSCLERCSEPGWAGLGCGFVCAASETITSL